MVKYYIEVLKPRASILLTFIGVCAAVVAADGHLSLRFLLIAATIFIASAGANGMTNYLDCGIDAKMLRTRHRVLPSEGISPKEKVLPLLVSLIIAGLVLSWFLHPFAFIADLVGTIAAVVWRKRAICVFPQGVIASCAPILMGWFSITTAFSWEIVLLCLLIALWVPLHVWSVMIAHRDDYLNAGLAFFPMSREVKDSVKVLLILAVVLYGSSIALYLMGDFALLYLILSNILGIIMVCASVRLVVSSDSQDAWKIYKISSFPYLGLLFLAMWLDIGIF